VNATRELRGDGQKLREPVIVDSTLHRAFTTLYAVYVVAGGLAAFTLPPSLESVGGPELTRFWILGLAVTSLCSFLFSLSEKCERREMISTILLLACLAIYSSALLIYGFGQWDLNRIVVGTFTLSFLILPSWRVQWFYRKYRTVPRG
jgi:hypothetical protein